jgi:pimeloyl-ACP methyl ester carboxylesterase
MHTVSRRFMLNVAIATPFLFVRPALAKLAAIEESGFVGIGGIDQWISIRGSDMRNPVILFLHGGPAEAQSPFLKEFLPWEESFTVINWDQRGAGKTFGRNGLKTPDMTVGRMAKDVVEIAEYANRKLHTRKVILVGHSWGAVLALHAVKLRPDLFSALVGTGQPVNWSLSVEDLERFARQRAMEAGDDTALANLDEASKLPVTDFKRLRATNKWRMSESDVAYLNIQRNFVGPPPLPTTGDVADWIAGGDFSGPLLWPTITSFDARSFAPALPIPFYVIQGRDDHVVSYRAAKDYLDQVRAPAKAFIPIDDGHFACFTDPAQFLTALRTRVGGLAATAQAKSAFAILG